MEPRSRRPPRPRPRSAATSARACPTTNARGEGERERARERESRGCVERDGKNDVHSNLCPALPQFFMLAFQTERLIDVQRIKSYALAWQEVKSLRGSWRQLFQKQQKKNKQTFEADRDLLDLFHLLFSLSLFLEKPKHSRHRYNWCSADYCEGGSPKGQCDLKDFDTSKPGEIWGCSGAGQLWKVSFCFPVSRSPSERVFLSLSVGVPAPSSAATDVFFYLSRRSLSIR